MQDIPIESTFTLLEPILAQTGGDLLVSVLRDLITVQVGCYIAHYIWAMLTDRSVHSRMPFLKMLLSQVLHGRYRKNWRGSIGELKRRSRSYGCTMESGIRSGFLSTAFKIPRIDPVSLHSFPFER